VSGRQPLSDRREDTALTEQNPAPGAPPEDPLRRVALIATAVLVPVVVAVAILVNVLGGSDASSGHGPATVDGSTPAQREDLPVLPLDVPPVTPEARWSWRASPRAACSPTRPTPTRGVIRRSR